MRLFAKVWLLTFLLIAGTVGLSWSLNGAVAPEPAASRSPSPQLRQVAKPIAEVQLGERVAGVNPIREQAEEVEPDPETWRKVSLRMKKESGKDLWIELLRPQTWVDLLEAKPGSTIAIDMPEMGAVGDAVVLDITDCPPIASGLGTVVTGKFRHEVDDDTEVVHLYIEGQERPTTVTATHPYWSVDRGKFVEASELEPNERLDTLVGLRKVVSTERLSFDGTVFNLETAEHVYRVGAIGALVHNSCTRGDFVRMGDAKQLANRTKREPVQVFQLSGPEIEFVKKLREAKPNLQIYRTNQKKQLGDFLVIDRSSRKGATGFLLDHKLGGGGAGNQLANLPEAQRIFDLKKLTPASGTTDELLNLLK